GPQTVVPEEEKPPPSELVYPAIDEVWQGIEMEVLSTVEYMRKETKNSIAMIFISGFKFSHTEETIARDFGIPFGRITLPLLEGIEGENKDMFMPVAALIYDTLQGAFMNLAPRKLTERDISTYKPVAACGLFLLGVIFFAHFIIAGTAGDLSKRAAGLQNEVMSYGFKGSSGTTKSLQREKDRLKGKVSFVNNVAGNKLFLTEKMSRLSKDITSHAWVNTISFTNGTSKEGKGLRITGSLYVSPDKGVAEINEILENMRRDAQLMTGFQDVSLVSATTRTFANIEIVDFEISLR
ncbi:MAG: hypothetical protein ABH885_02745, partial [Candidatus Omnitrophota bacterium]